MSVYAAASAVVPALIGAIPGVLTFALALWIAARAQSAEKQLEAIRKIVEDNGDQIVTRVKDAIRGVLGTHPNKRRWYE